ncbi:uncharacterized protein LOC109604903 [Aethina tumida]|uniref:uncharacterized protein LOC109604903 n=1 Tax=Aethina tumida TaxID=116153 RepID=UPI00096AEE4C|nr:uncharacterized protein LOC109604903 [Aethina tumida]
MSDSLIKDILKTGCSQLEAVITSQVYLELCELKKYWDVTYEYKSESGPFVTGSKTKSGPKECFVPSPVSKTFDFMQMQQIIQQHNNYSRVYLVFVSPDSTCVYYQISDGLSEMTDTEAKHLKEDKHEIINAELKKHQNNLEQAAMFGMPVCLSTKSKK